MMHDLDTGLCIFIWGGPPWYLHCQHITHVFICYFLFSYFLSIAHSPKLLGWASTAYQHLPQNTLFLLFLYVWKNDSHLWAISPHSNLLATPLLTCSVEKNHSSVLRPISCPLSSASSHCHPRSREEVARLYSKKVLKLFSAAQEILLTTKCR